MEYEFKFEATGSNVPFDWKVTDFVDFVAVIVVVVDFDTMAVIAVIGRVND